VETSAGVKALAALLLAYDDAQQLARGECAEPSGHDREGP
jgi:hypothetical protein